MLGVGGLAWGARGWVAGLGRVAGLDRPVGCSGALGV